VSGNVTTTDLGFLDMETVKQLGKPSAQGFP